ncbi:YdhR family protein [uncultured Paludibaculum sp.]|uniref:YdhR family protein n=1 Tax=uncultured Paludibaculum sp. TaxID=1765020 RepID=UPI002AAB470B|nr:YdhR family protein [uncultured Paludibaculum sp.]
MILQINFNLKAPVAEYRKMADSVAPAFLDVPGLRWKIWLLNPAAQEAGGIYLFDSQASLDAYLSGPLLAQIGGLTCIRNISMKQFEVMPEITALTRGLFEAACSSDA